MICCSQGNGRTLNYFALVSYIPDPLASFLDELRLDLMPRCNPHAHVTVLPPRPFTGDVNAAVEAFASEVVAFPPFEVTLGSIEVFPVSNVIYVSISGGETEIRDLHSRFNVGPLQHECNFPFHPHVTLAQDFEAEQVAAFLETARKKWAEYSGPRSFLVETLSFVHNVAIGQWDDLASVPLAIPSPVA